MNITTSVCFIPKIAGTCWGPGFWLLQSKSRHVLHDNIKNYPINIGSAMLMYVTVCYCHSCVLLFVFLAPAKLCAEGGEHDWSRLWKWCALSSDKWPAGHYSSEVNGTMNVLVTGAAPFTGSRLYTTLKGWIIRLNINHCDKYNHVTCLLQW